MPDDMGESGVCPEWCFLEVAGKVRIRVSELGTQVASVTNRVRNRHSVRPPYVPRGHLRAK